MADYKKYINALKQRAKEQIDKLRIWLAYYIMPKDTREYLLIALSYSIEELEREVTELFDQMNAESQEREDKE